MKVTLITVITLSILISGGFFLIKDKEPAQILATPEPKKPVNKIDTRPNLPSDQKVDQPSNNHVSFETGKPHHGYSEELEERYLAVSDNDRYPSLSSRLSEMTARRPNANYSPEDVLSAIEKPAAWESVSEPGPNLHRLTQEELDDGRQFVDFDPLKIETLMQGDYMDVAVDSIGRVFNMRIDSVRNFGDGNIMWKGPITNAEGGGVVTVTQSEKMSVASVVLSEQDYTLQSHGVDGWIINSGALFKINPNELDFDIPENEIH